MCFLQFITWLTPCFDKQLSHKHLHHTATTSEELLQLDCWLVWSTMQVCSGIQYFRKSIVSVTNILYALVFRHFGKKKIVKRGCFPCQICLPYEHLSLFFHYFFPRHFNYFFMTVFKNSKHFLKREIWIIWLYLCLNCGYS